MFGLRVRVLSLLGQAADALASEVVQRETRQEDAVRLARHGDLDEAINRVRVAANDLYAVATEVNAKS